MMVMYRNVPLRSETYDCKEGVDGKFTIVAWTEHKPALKDKHPLMNLPYVIDHASGKIVTQTNACFLFLGRKLKMLGKSEDDLCDCEQLLCEVMDVRNKVIDYSYGGEMTPADWLLTVCSPNGNIGKLNLWLERKYASRDAASTEPLFFVGDEVSAPDFHIFEMLDQIRGLAKFHACSDPFEGALSLLGAFHTLFAALPDNQRYFQSKLYALPCNNIMAKNYGATPSGAKWEYGRTDHYWKDCEGVY
jgi:hypothetical protein